MTESETVGNLSGGPVAGASAEYMERAQKLLPGGYGRSTFAGVGAGSPYIESGSGPMVRDVDGRELIDFNSNFTTLVHGNAHPKIVAASEKAIRAGSSFGMPHSLELDHAERLLARLDGLDQVRYTNSGSEAVSLAIRIARAVTGRDRIVFVRAAYHGTGDVALVSGGASYLRGIPKAISSDVSLVDINDTDSFDIATGPGEKPVAAVVIDLLPNRAGLRQVSPEFATAVEKRCQELGALLVADEVISFRLNYAGFHSEYGLNPDLITMGKLIGGGMPVGAVAGKTAVMEALDPRHEGSLEHGGTFSGNPVSMAAGAASLDLLDRDAIDRINKLGTMARERLSKRIDPLDWEVRGHGSLLRPFPKGASAAESAALQRKLWWSAYGRGVLLIQSGFMALSTAMDEHLVIDSIDRVADSVEEAVQ